MENRFQNVPKGKVHHIQTSNRSYKTNTLLLNKKTNQKAYHVKHPVSFYTFSKNVILQSSENASTTQIIWEILLKISA